MSDTSNSPNRRGPGRPRKYARPNPEDVGAIRPLGADGGPGDTLGQTPGEQGVDGDDSPSEIIVLPKMLVDDPIANPNRASHNDESAPIPEIAEIVAAVRDDARKVQYLIALTELGNRSRAARVARTTTATVWSWRRSDRKFAAAEKKAMEIAVDLAEDELVRRATEGVVEPVFQGGHLVGGIRRRSDQLLMFYLKAHRPDKYRETINQNVTVDVADRLIKARERVFRRIGPGDDSDGK